MHDPNACTWQMCFGSCAHTHTTAPCKDVHLFDHPVLSAQLATYIAPLAARVCTCSNLPKKLLINMTRGVFVHVLFCIQFMPAFLHDSQKRHACWVYAGEPDAPDGEIHP